MITRENMGTSVRAQINYDRDLALAYKAVQENDTPRSLGAVLRSHVNNARVDYEEFRCDDATLKFRRSHNFVEGDELVVGAECRHRISWPLSWVLGRTQHGNAHFGKLSLEVIESSNFSHRDPII